MKPTTIIEAHSSHVNKVLFSKDDSLLWSFGFSGELRAWNTSDWTLLRNYEGHTQTVNGGVELNGHLITISRDKSIHFFDINTGEVVRTVQDHKKPVLNIVKTRDERYVLTSGQDLMAVTRHTDGSIINQLKPNGKNLGVLTTTPDGLTALVGGYSKEIQLYSIPDLQPEGKLEACQVAATCVRCHPEKPLAWCLDYSGTLNVIETSMWERIQTVDLGRKGTMGMAYTPGRNELAITAEKAVLLMDAESLEVKQVLDSPPKGNYGINYSHNEQWLALASADKRVRVWKLD